MEEARSGLPVEKEGMPSLLEMALRVLRGRPQDRSARTVELFGWIDLGLGTLILLAPVFVASLLGLPELSVQAENYVRLVGLLVSGLGLLYIVSGRLNARGFVFASLIDRPMVPFVMFVLWYKDILPGALAVAFSVSDFGGFLWTLAAWRAEEREGRPAEVAGAGVAAEVFGFASGVVRNARVFHPDGRVFRGEVTSLGVADAALAAAGERLAGTAVLLRMGMGLMKKGMPGWLARIIPDAPSIAARFYDAVGRDVAPIRRTPEVDLDLLCTAGGDRLWKLVANLSTGGLGFGLRRYDYFRNLYYADVPYRLGGEGSGYWIRFAANEDAARLGGAEHDAVGRDLALTRVVEGHGGLRIEGQRVGAADAPFVAFAEIRFVEEIVVDQEALHFEPVEGRGFVPYGYLTEVRRSVYPASVESRPGTVLERQAREGESLGVRVERYVNDPRSVPLAGGEMMSDASRTTRHPKLGVALLAVCAVLLVVVVYMGVRFTRDAPVEYADDLMHFKYGSTGGERTMGIPYWFWVALPEMFPEYLPDGKAGRGYQSFGMIYEPGKDPRYDLPVGVSRRNFRGIDVVYLNCAVCHTGTVRRAAGEQRTIIAGMPANDLNLGAFEHFLTTIPLDQKFTPQRMLDQIDAMKDSPNRLIPKPDLINRLIFRLYASYVMREKMLMLRQRLGFVHAETWGPGRVDTFNAPKALLNFNMTHADARELMGNADFPSIWNQGPREGMRLHWDGNNTSVDERNLSAAFGTGAYPPTLDPKLVLRTRNWLMTAKPLAYPYGIDEGLAAKGKGIYEARCMGCHGTREAPFRSTPLRGDEKAGDPVLATEKVGSVVPIDLIGTDRHRYDSYTYLVAANQGTLYAGFEKDWGYKPDYPQRFSHFHKTTGYANMPLDGIWLRAPYLHNGSVPNLRELLEPQEKRSAMFYRGNDVYDTQNVGYVSTAAEQDGTVFFKFDTSANGNGNQGHLYGIDLPGPDKDALIEYLKKF